HNAIIAIPKPGDVLARSDQDFRAREFVDRTRHAMDAVGWLDMDFMVARVRSRSGFAGHISLIHEIHRGFSELEREHLSTVAHLASHALSGSVGPRTDKGRLPEMPVSKELDGPCRLKQGDAT